MKIKTYECKICKDLNDRGIKGQERFGGSRQDVRKHLVQVHRIRGRKNTQGLQKKDFGKSNITKNTLVEDF